jgi:hypothetical protein
LFVFFIDMRAMRIIETRDRIARAAYAAMRRVELDAARWSAEGPALKALPVEPVSGVDDPDRELFKRDSLLSAT